MNFVLILLAAIVITSLAWYAGSLLYKLQVQKRNIAEVSTQRLNKITESIRVIALAMAQQQCNLSEGCIRLYHLLECLPITNKSDFSHTYTGIYSLYREVKDLPTHQTRKLLSREEVSQQDTIREHKEALFEAQILKDVAILKKLTV
jgi:uncharacterized SAM-binding protein YcdF (DUF218 family)